MANTFYIKNGDTSPTLTQTLQDAGGNAVSLVGATVNFHVNDRYGNNIIDAAATISNDAGGIVTYTFAAIAAGNYNYEFEVTYSDSSVETFPNEGYDLLIVSEDLA